VQRVSDPYYLKVIEKELSNRKKKLPHYTLRKYAIDLEILAPTLSNVLKGKRSPSFFAALKIAEHLKLDEKSKETFLESVLKNKKSRAHKKISCLQKSPKIKSHNHDEIVADPIYLSAFSFMGSDIPVKNAETLAGCLGISRAKANEVIAKLYAASLLVYKDKKLELATNTVQSFDEVPSSAIRAAHRATLISAIEKLEKTPLELRDYRDLKFPINTKAIPAIKKEMKRFIDKIYKLSEEYSDKNEIYELALQLFPLKKSGETHDAL
jgi:uncharacterized protein (TIGR02147 family)